MAKLVKRRRGTTLEHASFTGSEGETTIDLDKETVVVHNGAQAGGFPLAREDMNNVAGTDIASRLVNLIGVTELKTADGTNGQVLRTNGSGTISFGTIDTSATVVGGDISGTVANAQIVASAVGTTELATNAVTTVKITDANITTAKLATDAVTTAKIVDDAITTAKIIANAITTAKITDANVTTAKLATNVITTVKITDANVTEAKLATNAVTTAKIADANVTDVKIATMTSSKLTGALPAIDGSNLTGLTSIPTGIIAIWSGATNAIPTGWLICDGTNSTPDLRDKFIVGAGSTYSVGATGGSSTTGSHTLTIAELAAHTHTTAFGGTSGESLGQSGPSVRNNASVTNSTGSSAAHTHTGTLPPYYALAYIMKT